MMPLIPRTLGIHSTVYALYLRLMMRWVPKWMGAFEDSENGGFYERLGAGFKPVQTGQRRLLSQCRQLALYADYARRAGRAKGLDGFLRRHFDHILKTYKNRDSGLWIYAVDDALRPSDTRCDLYTMSFVIFACAHYGRVSNDRRARDEALATLQTIRTRFKMSGAAGYAEALDEQGAILPAVRRQNPHMHLLEACLFAHQTWGNMVFEQMADEMVELFYNHFYFDAAEGVLEFLTPDLNAPDPQKGAHLEAGHFFEWVWLLKRHAVMKGDAARHNAIIQSLIDFANRFGWDDVYGGIYDEVDKNGAVLKDTKRIWPFCEALKANALVLNDFKDPVRSKIKTRTTDMVRVFVEKYMQERGFWQEWLNRDLSPAVDYMPATTPYHVYFGITETMDILKARGRTKSWLFAVNAGFYAGRRGLSRAVRLVRTGLMGGIGHWRR